MLSAVAGLFAGLILSMNANHATPVDYQKMADAGLDRTLLEEALQARDAKRKSIKNDRYLTIIDYRKPSSEERLYLIDTYTGEIDSMLVAHGQGSDPNHDGYADKFSDVPESKMTSIGSYVTAETYYGNHGLSLRLDGLDKSNRRARERLIVIHGADYVNPSRGVQGRSWGCPSVEKRLAKKLIETIKGGSFIYAAGGGLTA